MQDREDLPGFYFRLALEATRDEGSGVLSLGDSEDDGLAN